MRDVPGSAGSSGRSLSPLRLPALFLVAFASQGQGQLPASSLAVREDGEWVTWWNSEAAPTHWAGPLPQVVDAVVWRAIAPGLELGEVELAGTGTAWRTQVVLVRLDPDAVSLQLVHPAPTPAGMPGRWSIRDAPDEAVLAMNAGQFGGNPWGWVVRDGVEVQPPGFGPLAPGVVIDTRRQLRIVSPDSLSVIAADAWQAFQSYPMLLAADGVVPTSLRAPGRGIDVRHRDTRFALGTLPDGRVLLALTRFRGLGGLLEVLPFGPTTPEMAALMGALGCRRAVLMDGGISSQLAVGRGPERRTWPGLRSVALGLIAIPR